MQSSKKKKKNLITLLAMTAALVILVVGYMAASRWKEKEEEKENIEEPEIVLYSLESDAVLALNLRSGDYEVTLRRDENAWEVAEDNEFPLDSSAVEKMLDSIAEFQAKRLVQKQVENLSEYGLDAPDVSVGIQKADGVEDVICIGDKSGIGGGYYACLKGSQDVYLISEQVQEVFGIKEENLVLLDTVPVFSADTANGLKVSGERFPEFTIAESDDKRDLTAMALYLLYLYGTYREPVLVDIQNFSEIMKNYTSMDLGSFVSYHAEDKEKYGLKNPKDALTVWYKNEEVQQEFTVYFGSMDLEETGYYVNLEGSNQIFLMEKESAEALLSLDTFQAVNKYTQMVNIKIVGGLEITYDNKTNFIGIVHKEETSDSEQSDTTEHFFVNGRELDTEEGEVIRDLYQELIGMKITRPLSEDEVVMEDAALELQFFEDEEKQTLLHSIRYLALAGNSQEFAVEINGTSLFAADAETVDTAKKRLEEYEENLAQ